jgi:uncharacterized membrane protein
VVNKFIKIVLTLSIFIASISLFYKFILEPFQKENKLDQCLKRVEELHTKRWNNSCKALGQKAGCGLDKDTATIHLRVYEKEKEECYKKYE